MAVVYLIEADSNLVTGSSVIDFQELSLHELVGGSTLLTGIMNEWVSTVSEISSDDFYIARPAIETFDNETSMGITQLSAAFETGPVDFVDAGQPIVFALWDLSLTTDEFFDD